MDSKLEELDALVICLPVTEQTRGLFNDRRIKKLKRGSIMVNIAREDVVDYAALSDAVESGHLGGAALDVFDKEPLSRWNRLWRIDNVLVSPHISSVTGQYKSCVADFICDNIGRFLSGQLLRGEVDRTKGY